uniref:glucan endo-1,3-beta-D-glucosidase n=1 Tax=Fagus sylvatica TaxID=28930 RepID=A0A2N9E942_FAGSY
MGLVIALLLSFLFRLSSAQSSKTIGINYGTLGNNLPSPYQSIELIKSMKAGRVKLYDANPEILKLLSGTNLQVSIMVPNNEISNIASNQTIADQWVQNNVLAYYPNTMIRFVLVGNEVFSYNTDHDRRIWFDLVPAMRKIKRSLKNQNITNIKIGTPLAMDIMQSTFPPSSGNFRSDLIDTVMVPLLKFLNGTKSFFFIDVYTYFPWSSNPTSISLDHALLRGNDNYTDPLTSLVYTNLLDQMLDSLFVAMSKLGFPKIKLYISETGWPSSGDIEELGANINNAATYNRNLIRKLTSTPAIGTPARPGIFIPTFIFALYNENQKIGPGTERNWGLLSFDGSPVYDIDLTGKRALSDYPPLPAADNNSPYRGEVWCVVRRGVDLMELGSALAYACGDVNGTCEALVPGRECYEPVSVTWHASYAFSSYWARFRSSGATCYFNGLAEETTRNPKCEGGWSHAYTPSKVEEVDR